VRANSELCDLYVVINKENVLKSKTKKREKGTDEKIM